MKHHQTKEKSSLKSKVVRYLPVRPGLPESPGGPGVPPVPSWPLGPVRKIQIEDTYYCESILAILITLYVVHSPQGPSL